MGRRLSELQTLSSKHQWGTSRGRVALWLEGQQCSQFTLSAPFPLDHQSHCILCFQGGNCKGIEPGQWSPLWAPHQNDKRPLSKSEPEPTQQWDRHQTLNTCPDSQKLHQTLCLHNTVNNISTLCWADATENLLTVSSLATWWTGQWISSLLCFTFRTWLCSHP